MDITGGSEQTEMKKKKIFQLFGNREAKQDDATVPALKRTHKQTETAGKANPSQFVVGSGQSVGRQRSHNEDALFTLSSVISDMNGSHPFCLSIVADGMGGHKHGEVASGACIRAVVNVVLNELFFAYNDLQPGITTEIIHAILEKAVAEAQKAVTAHAPGGGTTLVIGLVVEDNLHVAHVGDSRAYLFTPAGELTRLTRDHSLVQRMVDLQEISEKEAANHPQKNVLLRAVGQPDTYPVDITTIKIPAGGKMMLCSDGLWGVVPDQEIRRIISSVSDPITLSNELVAAANLAGGPDNISVTITVFPV